MFLEEMKKGSGRRFEIRSGFIPSVIYEIKRLTEFADYKCGFSDGACKHYKGEKKDYTPPVRLGCCCHGCASTFGHHIVVYSKYDKIYEACWSEDLGFYCKEKGCKLPRVLRSQVCLAYCCSNDTLDEKSKMIIGLAAKMQESELVSTNPGACFYNTSLLDGFRSNEEGQIKI